MVSRRTLLSAGTILGIAGLETPAAMAKETAAGPILEGAAPAGFNTDPESYDWVAVYKTFLSSISLDGHSIDTVTHNSRVMRPQGAKGEAVKLAIKGAIKTLNHIGKKSWEKAISRVPLPGVVKKYLGFETVMKALNVAVDFEGTVTDAIKHGLEKVGVPGWAAGIAARAISTILL